MKRKAWRGVVLLLVMAGCGDALDLEEVQSNLNYGNCGTFNDDQVCICTAVNGGGTCAILSLSTRFYTNLATFTGLTAFNNSISSISLGPNVKARLCTDASWGGTCVSATAGLRYNYLTMTQGCPSGPWPDVGWGYNCMNDVITSIRLDPTSYNCTAPGPNQISLFTAANYGGDCVVLDRGSYPNTVGNPTSGFSGGAFGLPNDTVSSMCWGTAPSMSVYPAFDFGGVPTGCWNGACCPTMGSYNDVVSSVNAF